MLLLLQVLWRLVWPSRSDLRSRMDIRYLLWSLEAWAVDGSNETILLFAIRVSLSQPNHGQW